MIPRKYTSKDTVDKTMNKNTQEASKPQIPLFAKIFIIVSFIPLMVVLFIITILVGTNIKTKHNTYRCELIIEDIKNETITTQDIDGKEYVATCKIKKIEKTDYQKTHSKDYMPHINDEIKLYEITSYDYFKDIKDDNKDNTLYLDIYYGENGDKKIEYPFLSAFARYPKFELVEEFDKTDD